MHKLIPILAALAAASPALAADPAPVLAADREFAAVSASKGPRAAFLAYLAPSATVVNQGAVDTGTPEHFAAFFPADPAAMGLVWTPSGGAMSQDGTMGVTWGTWTRQFAGKPGGTGAYSTAWRKAADGRWQVVNDTVSDAPAVQARP